MLQWMCWAMSESDGGGCDARATDVTLTTCTGHHLLFSSTLDRSSYLCLLH
jgi:hypothetical protein